MGNFIGRIKTDMAVKARLGYPSGVDRRKRVHSSSDEVAHFFEMLGSELAWAKDFFGNISGRKIASRRIHRNALLRFLFGLVKAGKLRATTTGSRGHCPRLYRVWVLVGGFSCGHCKIARAGCETERERKATALCGI